MFSGIIERLGHVAAVVPGGEAGQDPSQDPGQGDVRLDLRTGFPDLALGESVAVNGVCLTVTRFDDDGLATFFASTETLSVTALRRLRAGDRVNLERAVTPSTRLSGHIVQGHVDGVAILRSVEPAGDAWSLRFSLPASLRRYCVLKGSITLDGISLTLNRLDEPAMEDGEERFAAGVTVIPHTWEHTTLGGLLPQSPVNVEVDVMAKYVEQLLRAGS